MTFDRAWVLIFALVPVAWAVREWTSTVRRGALLLKAADVPGHHWRAR